MKHVSESSLQVGRQSFVNELLGFEVNKLATAIGPLYSFNVDHPSGHYQLRTANYCDKLLLRKLQSISASCKEEALTCNYDSDCSQGQDFEGFRCELFAWSRCIDDCLQECAVQARAFSLYERTSTPLGTQNYTWLHC